MTAEEVFRDLKPESEMLADRRRDLEIERLDIVAEYESRLAEVDRRVGDINSRLAALAVDDIGDAAGDGPGIDFDAMMSGDPFPEDGG